MPAGFRIKAGVNDLNVRSARWRPRATSLSSALASSAARSRTSWRDAARRSRSSTIARREWARRRRRPACSHRSSRPATPGALLDLTARSLDLYDNFVARVAADSRSSVNYQRTGTLDVALGDEAMRELSARHAFLEERGVAAELLDAQAVRASEPSLSSSALGGLLIPDAWVCRGVRAHARAWHRRLGVMARGFWKRPRPSHRAAGRRTPRRNGARFAYRRRRGDCCGKLGGPMEIEGAEALPIKPIRGQLLQLAWTGAAAETGALGRALLPRAVVRSNGARRRHRRRRGVRRAHDGGRGSRPHRGGLRAGPARVDGKRQRAKGRPAAGDARSSADHRLLDRHPQPDVRDRPLPKRRSPCAAHCRSRGGSRHARGSRRSDARRTPAAALRCR